MSERWTVKVGEEETSALLDRAEGSDRALILGHGASTNMEHRNMERLAGEFCAQGLNVVRFNFLYTEKKKGPPDRMPRLMECYRAVAEKARAELRLGSLYLGGHSMGGRTASMLAAEGFPCSGLILLAYPLHPAVQPEKLRDAHLPQITAAVLCLNGTRDELCWKDLMEEVMQRLPATWTMHWLEGADHGYHVQKRSGRTEDDVLHEIGAAAKQWIMEEQLTMDN